MLNSATMAALYYTTGIVLALALLVTPETDYTLSCHTPPNEETILCNIGILYKILHPLYVKFTPLVISNYTPSNLLPSKAANLHPWGYYLHHCFNSVDSL